MTDRLTRDDFDSAVQFILDNGTNLHRQRYRYHFENSDARHVVAALAEYQNSDGGFGNGLESDLRTRNSSVVCTTVALQILGEIDAPVGTPMVSAAMHYLVAQYRDGNWRLIGEDCNDAPHAPWWRYDPDSCVRGRFLANPGAEILGYLTAYPHKMCQQTVTALFRRAQAHIENEPLEVHDLLCYERLYQCLAPEMQAQMLPHLLRSAFDIVKVEESDWEEYCLTPLDLVERPGSLFADFFAEYLDRNLDFRIHQQRADGSWQPTWSWGSEFPATWRVIEPEISAEVTLKSLLQLRSFGLVGL